MYSVDMRSILRFSTFSNESLLELMRGAAITAHLSSVQHRRSRCTGDQCKVRSGELSRETPSLSRILNGIAAQSAMQHCPRSATPVFVRKPRHMPPSTLSLAAAFFHTIPPQQTGRAPSSATPMAAASSNDPATHHPRTAAPAHRPEATPKGSPGHPAQRARRGPTLPLRACGGRGTP